MREAFRMMAEQPDTVMPRSKGVLETVGFPVSFLLCGWIALRAAKAEPFFRNRKVARWIVASACVGISAALAQIPTRQDRQTRNRAGGAVIIPPPGAPDAFAQPGRPKSPIGRVSVKNPPGALTFILSLRRSIDEYYGEQQFFRIGVADIKIDSDNNPKSGARDQDPRLDGFEIQAHLGLLAQRHRTLAQWMNASSTVGAADHHLTECRLMKYGPAGFRYAERRILDRSMIDGQRILVTVRYSELGVGPGDTIRVAILDRSGGYDREEILPEFRLVLK